MLRAAIMESPPPMVGTKRLKLFYATQSTDGADEKLTPPKFVLFVNQPKLLTDTYARYLEGRIRAAEPYPGLPIQLSCRARTESL
jgi:GTP-binding protein